MNLNLTKRKPQSAGFYQSPMLIAHVGYAAANRFHTWTMHTWVHRPPPFPHTHNHTPSFFLSSLSLFTSLPLPSLFPTLFHWRDGRRTQNCQTSWGLEADTDCSGRRTWNLGLRAAWLGFRNQICKKCVTFQFSLLFLSSISFFSILIVLKCHWYYVTVLLTSP